MKLTSRCARLPGKVRPEVSRAIFDQPSGYIDAREALVREFDVRIGLVVAQQDVEPRLVLLDQVVLERERFLLVIDENVVDVARFRDQRAGLDVRQLVVVEIAANARPEDLRLADVDDFRRGVLVQIHAGREG